MKSALGCSVVWQQIKRNASQYIWW